MKWIVKIIALNVDELYAKSKIKKIFAMSIIE